MTKYLRYMCIIIFILFFVAIFIGRNLIYHMEYEYFTSTIKYFSTPIEEVHKQFHKLDNVLIDDESIDNIGDLIEQSEYVLRISIEKEPIFYGYGIINQVKVLEIIKGDNKISIGENLKVYDLISSWMGDYVNYYGGITPLNKNYNYIIFIKEAPQPNMENTYIFSSIRFGHFNISIKEPNVLQNYIQGSLYIKDIMNYDYVETDCESSGYGSCDSYIDEYTKMKNELLEYLG